MLNKITTASAALLLLAPVAHADELIASAMSAAPDSLARNATIQRWDGTVL